MNEQWIDDDNVAKSVTRIRFCIENEYGFCEICFPKRIPFSISFINVKELYIWIKFQQQLEWPSSFTYKPVNKSTRSSEFLCYSWVLHSTCSQSRTIVNISSFFVVEVFNFDLFLFFILFRAYFQICLSIVLDFHICLWHVIYSDFWVFSLLIFLFVL